MTSVDAPLTGGERRAYEKRIALRMGAIGLAIALGAAGAVALTLGWAERQREAMLTEWQIRLGLVAESHAAAVSAWVEDQTHAVSSLANNEAVRLYAGEVLRLSGAGAAEALAERQYLENALLVTAQQQGFALLPYGVAVPANVDRTAVAGMAVLDSDGAPLVVTPGFPPASATTDGLLQKVRAEGGAMLSDPYRDRSGEVDLAAAAAPLYAVQSDTLLGFVVGVKPLRKELYPLLRRPGSSPDGVRSVLLARRGEAVRFLSPPAEGPAPLPSVVSADTPDSAEAYAVDSVFGFATRRNYANTEVLAASRPIGGTDWVVMTSIGRDAALDDAEDRLLDTVALIVVLVLVACAAMAALWRHGASRRADRAATLLGELARKHQAQAVFVRRLTDTLPNVIFVVRADGTITFANDAFAGAVGAASADALAGKNLNGTYGPASARIHMRRVEDVLSTGVPGSHLDREGEGEAETVVRTMYVPIELDGHGSGVLVVQADLSDLVSAQARAHRTLEDVVGILVSLLDQRDPNAANHSSFTGEVARTIATEIGLDAVLVDTVEKAARLLNIGRIFVPLDILTKESGLTEQEYGVVEHSLGRGIEMLAEVRFEGPVVETLRQAREKVDGSGKPAGREGEEILVTARVLAAANAFVAMISPRAHRPAMEVDGALAVLMSEAGQAFDRRIVVALMNIVENKGGRTRWAGLGS